MLGVDLRRKIGLVMREQFGALRAISCSKVDGGFDFSQICIL